MTNASFAKYCVFAAAAAVCAVLIVLRPPEREILKMLPVTQRTAYLDCAVVQRDRTGDPDLEVPCTMFA
ncbi:hypothetical protein WG902_10680 [Ramlibacter sp. PS3R-8]|uniref:hypothetical protein n=1 Tax=Ramlibacter sp. PS3R-8 TaxID=3133437 RepID=UPI0030A1143B